MGRAYTARMLFRDFRKDYPELWRPGANYQLVNFMTIMIWSPGVGKFTYEWHGKKIKWIECWEDERENKRIERERRPKLYRYFKCLLEDYMETTGCTQQNIADMTGISRKSINEYLNGRQIPKSSTMYHILDSLKLRG